MNQSLLVVVFATTLPAGVLWLTWKFIFDYFRDDVS
jgi:hypothetical protein